MEISHIFGYIGAVFTGFILGLLGGGGGLLAIPVLVYLFKIEASVATGYSLFLLAISASSGAVQNIRKKLVDFNAALYYGVPSVITLFVVRRFLMPAVPAIIFHSGNFTLSKKHLILVLLSIVMFGASYKMITAKKKAAEATAHKTHHFVLAAYAIIISLFMGFVGTGGGFLVVPALIYFANVPPKRAIGTALVIVSANSFVGFMGDVVRPHNAFDWQFLFTFSFFSIAGVLIGHYITQFIHNDKLQKYFGVFILIIAIFIIVKEGFLKI